LCGVGISTRGRRREPGSLTWKPLLHGPE
jgi:hypothetical protein